MFTGINGIVEGTPVSVRGAGSRRLVINVPEGTEVVVANKELPKKNPLWDKALEVEDVKPGMFFLELSPDEWPARQTGWRSL